ncbi:MAG TPA: hypothetical protein VKY26_07880 [Actinomycetota bacterium]|nr:hypothetical protein [Actinomycetota bacterium]
MSLKTPPDDAERQAALDRLPGVREQATSRRLRRRAVVGGAMAACLVLVVAGILVSSRHTPVHVTVGDQAGSGTPWPAPSPATFRSYKPDAEALLNRLQSGFVVPPGATILTADPPSGLEQAATAIGPGVNIATHRLWTVPGTPETAISFLQGHLVSGTAMGDSGVAANDPPPLWFDEDVTETGLVGDVTPEVVPGPAGTTILRVDFEVAYSPGRPNGEEVTASDRYVSVSRGAETFPTPSPARQVTFTDPASVVALADAFNALVATSGAEYESCPGPLVSYRISFRPSATAPPDFVVQGPDCNAWYVSVNGKATGELEESSNLNSLLSSLVGP